ncbi:hypothetical protein DRO26_00720 [Candidatus Bathyarchaeota archaeon]|nr:MAG: hypothetical protein DRO26_00720 [Candidatus Bathyarchaeota archaeon]
MSGYEELSQIRRKIDDIDEKIVRLLVERFKLVAEVFRIKQKQGLPIVDVKRENQILTRVGTFAEKEGIKKEFMEEIFRKILDSSVKFEKTLS